MADKEIFRLPPPVLLASLRAPTKNDSFIYGQMAEWSNAHAWKACEAAMSPRVRIPLCPPFSKKDTQYECLFYCGRGDENAVRAHRVAP